MPGWVAAWVESPPESKGSVESKESVDDSVQKPKPAGAPVRVGRAKKISSSQVN